MTNVVKRDGKTFLKLADQLAYSEVDPTAKRFLNEEGYSIVFSRKETKKYDGFYLTTYSLFGWRGGKNV